MIGDGCEVEVDVDGENEDETSWNGGGAPTGVYGGSCVAVVNVEEKLPLRVGSGANLLSSIGKGSFAGM
jgi:hypothetical protein